MQIIQLAGIICFFTGNPSFCIILANFRAARLDSSSLLAPVQTSFPDRKMSAVARGFRIRIISPVKRAGLYSEFLVRMLMYVRFNSVPRFTVDTTFCRVGSKFSAVLRAGCIGIICDWGCDAFVRLGIGG